MSLNINNYRRVLVTGGFGFIGAALVRALVERGYKVRVFDNGWRGDVKRLNSVRADVEIIEGDVRDISAVESACAGIDAVFHLAAINGTRYFYERPDLVLEVGVKGTISVIDACLKKRVKRLLVASSAEVYQQPTHIPTTETERLIVPDLNNPRFSYGGSKIADELLAIHYAVPRGLDTIIFRPHNIYGPEMGYEHVIPQMFLRLARLTDGFAKKIPVDLPILGTGKETRTYCYVSDCCRAIILCLERAETSEIYHVGDDQEEISADDLAVRIGQAVGIKVVPVPGKLVPGQTDRRMPSIEKLRALGYKTQTSFSEGLLKTVEAYLQAPLPDRPDWSEYLNERARPSLSLGR